MQVDERARFVPANPLERPSIDGCVNENDKPETDDIPHGQVVLRQSWTEERNNPTDVEAFN